MSTLTQPGVANDDRGRVLTKALRSVAAALGLTQRELAAITGASPASVSRLGRDRTLPYPGKEAELAALLVRLYRSLDTLVGGDAAKARAWFRAPNVHLNGRPCERVQTVEGLADVVHYLDAMRGTL